MKGGQMSWGTVGTLRRPIQPSNSINHHLKKELNIDANFCLAHKNNDCYPPITCKSLSRRRWFTCPMSVFTYGAAVHCLASGRAHHHSSFYKRWVTDEKHDRDDKRNYTVRTSACEIPGCSAAAAEDSVQLMTYLWYKYILFMAHMAWFIYDLYSLLE